MPNLDKSHWVAILITVMCCATFLVSVLAIIFTTHRTSLACIEAGLAANRGQYGSVCDWPNQEETE